MWNFSQAARWAILGVAAAGLVFVAGAETKSSQPAPRLLLGINHSGFVDADAQLFRQLSPSPVPLRLTFYWHNVAQSADYYDSQVAAATRAGVPILGILGYSSKDGSSMPVDFDFTEISPFDISWHSVEGYLPWGSDGAQGTAKYLWNDTLEDGQTYPRVVEAKPATEGRFAHGAVNFAVPMAHSVVLQAKVGFRRGSDPGSHVNFSVTYLKGGEFSSLANTDKEYDGTLATLTADLTNLAGTTVKLFLNVDPIGGDSAGDPVWEEARILVDGVRLSMSQVVGDNVQSVINYPPGDFDAFAGYAGDLARRYPQIQEWEVWNEPNISFFWRPTVDAEAYTQLLKKAYNAVKAANPSTKVILGGLSSVVTTRLADSVLPGDFLSRIYRNGGGAFFDAVAYHAYGNGARGDWLSQQLQPIRDLMDANGDTTKPIWITEIGCYTNGPGAVSEELQAEYLRQMRTILESLSYVERVYWFTLTDGPSAAPEWNYGLFRADGSPKPAVSAFVNPKQ